MKKTLFLLTLLIGWSNHSNAQYYYNKFICNDCYTNIEVGAIAPMFSGLQNARSDVGYSVSVGSYLELTDRVFIKFGPSFSQFKIDFNSSKIEDLTIYTVVGNFGVHLREKKGYQFFSGVNLETNISKNFLSEGSTYHDVEFLTYSLYAGAGLIVSERIEVNARYNFALNNLNTNPALKWKRNYFAFSLGYTFL